VPAASSTGVPLLLDPRPRLIDRPREKVIGNLHALRRASSALWGGQESGPRGGPACNGTSRGWVKPRAGEREGAASRPVVIGAFVESVVKILRAPLDALGRATSVAARRAKPNNCLYRGRALRSAVLFPRR
jgi:hypothetical protein